MTLGTLPASNRPTVTIDGCGRVDLTRHDRLNRRNDEAADNHRIDGFVRPRCVPTPPRDTNFEVVCGSTHRPVGHNQSAGREVPIQVAGKRDGDVVEHAGLHEGLGTGTLFLGGLEDQADASGQIAFTRQKLGRAQEYAGVPIVATSVHDAVVGRSERQPGLLLNGQGIDVGPQGHGRKGIGAGQIGNHPRSHQTPMGDSQLVQRRADALGSPVLLPAQLGILMQVAADRDHALHDRRLHSLSHGPSS